MGSIRAARRAGPAHASAADIESLGEEVRRRVRDRSGVELVWEIKRIGRPAARAQIKNGEQA